jgi:hypothetical protein
MPPLRPGRGGLPADARLCDLVVELGDELVKVGGVLPGRGGLVAVPLGLGAQGDPPLLVLAGRAGGEAGFVLEVPAFPALGGAQGLGPLRARRAYRVQRAPARHQDGLRLAGFLVGAAQLDRPDARAVLDGHVPKHVTSQRHGHPVGPGIPGGRHTDHLGFGHH